MKKVNRLKALRVGTAILSTALITSMSGCSGKDSRLTKQQRQLIRDDVARMARVNDMFELSDRINDYFEDNNIEGKIREKDGIKYVDYPTNYIKVNDEYLSKGEISDELDRLDEMSMNGKLDEMAYINRSINTCNLLPAYENLYRDVLTRVTGLDYINAGDEDTPYVYYILDGEKLIKDVSGNYSENAVDLLMVHYNIDKDSAMLLVKLIMNRQDLKGLYNIMESDPNFGPEDYIIESKKNYERMIDTYYDVLVGLDKLTDSNSSVDVKTKLKAK